MSNIVIVAFAVALLLALFEPVIDVITIFLPPKLVNLVISGSLGYLGLYLLEPEPIKVMLVKTLAASFLSRVSLTIAERASTYRWASIKQSN